MENINQIIGKNLLLLRKEKKLTQVELAEIFNYSDKSISKWETGESLPSVEILYELAKFYGTTLDSLTKENFKIEKAEEKRLIDKLLPAHIVITLLATSLVWFVATILFVCLKLTFGVNYGLVFLWALPVSCILLIVFNAIWGKSYLLIAILTVLIWSILASIHLQVLVAVDYSIWPIYLLGIPLQVAVILWGALLNKPKKKKHPKPKKDKKKKKEESISQNNEK